MTLRLSLVLFLRGVAHQFVDQRQRRIILHADNRFHAHWVEEQRLAAVLGVGAHQRVNAGWRQLAATVVADLARGLYLLW